MKIIVNIIASIINIFITSIIFSVIIFYSLIHCDTNNIVEIKVIVGGNVRLPCNVTNQIEDDSVTLILWYKEGTGGQPIYTLDSRANLDTDGPQVFSHQRLDNRASFEFNKSSVHGSLLLINPVTNEDNGNYKCRVDFRRGRTQVTNINLFVIVPPSRISIINGDNGKEIILPNPVSFDENANINLICQSSGGRPSPSLFWYHDDQLIDNSFDIIDSNIGLVENHLTIINIDKKILNSILSCKATNNNFTNGPTISLTLDINIKPNSVEITNDRQPISAGRKIEIICVASGSRPPARVTWFKDDKPMIRSRQSYSADGLVTTSALILMPTRDDDKANIFCKADNPRLNNSFIQDSWILEVYYDPKVSLTIGNSSRAALVKAGDRVELNCNVSANPMVFEVRWYRDGEPLIKHRVKQLNTTLIIEKTIRQDHGRYQCSAMNIEGQTMSNVFHLEVHYPPTCKKGQRGIVGVSLGETLRITCEVEASPGKVDFYWLLNGSMGHENQPDLTNFKFNSEGLISKLEYQVKSKDDFGIFECWSRNAIGPQLEPCLFTLIPSGPPEALSECTIYERLSDKLFIKCLPGYDGGLNQTFNSQVLDNRKQIIQNISNPIEPIFNISDLTPESSYILMLFSSNSNGSSRIISLTTTTRSWRDDGDFVLYLFDSNIMSAVRLGLISAVILLSLVVTIAFGIRKHRQLKTTVIKQSNIMESESFGDNLTDSYAKPFTSGAINPDVVPSSKDCYIDKVNDQLIGTNHYTNYVLPSYNQMSTTTSNYNYTIGFTGSQGYGINFVDKKLYSVGSFPNFRETINNLQEVNCDNSIALGDLTMRSQLLPRRSFQHTNNLRINQQRNVHFGTNISGFSTPV
ncbi:hemicentin-1-like isoform X2 [Panonychus citri]|uniref:hemicentin-1-like isoform X2 n=1 Tax=Panonychus citri TaxID=50023 RepID=UPI002307CE1B|nr:hemicentin-1-like isoform X2 [Panonychus citri]